MTAINSSVVKVSLDQARAFKSVSVLVLLLVLFLIDSPSVFAFDPFEALKSTPVNKTADTVAIASSLGAVVCFIATLILLGIVYGRVLAGGVNEGTLLVRAYRAGLCLIFLALMLGLIVGVPLGFRDDYSGIFLLDSGRSLLEAIKSVRPFRYATLLDVQKHVLWVIPLALASCAAWIAFYTVKKTQPHQFWVRAATSITKMTRAYLDLFIYWPFRFALRFNRPLLFFPGLFLTAFLLGELTKNIQVGGIWLLPAMHLRLAFCAAAIGSLLSIVSLVLGRFYPTAWIMRLMSSGGVAAWNVAVNRINRKNPDVIALGKQITSGMVKPEVFFTERNLNYNVQIIGGSGTGKSNLIQGLIENRIARDSGVIFVDLKADFETVDWLTAVTTFYNRVDDLQVFSLTDRDISIPYNPLESGTLNEIHSRIMNSLKWSEEYYRKTASAALSDVLMGLYELREQAGEHFTLEHLYAALSRPEILESWAIRSELGQKTKNVLLERTRRLKTKEGTQEVAGLVTDLQLLIRSSAGGLLTEDAGSRLGINLEKAIRERKIVYFLMNSMQDKESSVAIGKLFLQDLISTVGRIYKTVPEERRQSVTLIVDEFASFATENFIDLLNRSRGAKMGIVIAHQSRGDLEAISPTFSDQVERNCNNKVIYGTDNPNDAEYYAAMIGTRTTMKETRQVQEGILWTDTDTGMKSVREVDEFVIHPNRIKELGQGQALVIKRIVDPGYALVNLYRAEPAPELPDNKTATDILSNARHAVLSGPKHRMVKLEGTPNKTTLGQGQPQEDESFS